MHDDLTSPSPRRFRLLTTGALLALVGMTALVGCSDDSGDDDATTTTSESDTTTSADTSGDTEPETTEPETTDKTEPADDVDETDVPEWRRTAVPYRGDIGETVDFECTPDGEPFTVWGTNIYTDDSSVCTAAVHAGLITFEDGGTVTVQIGEGEDGYIGSLANDVESFDYGSWGGSFSFPDADVVEVSEGIAWDRAATYYLDQADADITVTCRADGEAASVWGTDVYTSDSSICTAAVHAGLIDLADGGEVTFRIIEGQESYEGSEANGVTTSDYGSWDASFEFVGT